jgi:6,7-dimethyl-8-ribityllumazine synthase
VTVRERRPGHDAHGLRFVLVAARFNEAYVRRMVDAAREVLVRGGASESDLEVWWVPGSFELPLACKWAAESGRCDAVLAFGVLIRGETEHFRLVAEASAHGLTRAALDASVPVLNGVLAVHDAGQAAARTGGPLGNRGADVALAAIQMAGLARERSRP